MQQQQQQPQQKRGKEDRGREKMVVVKEKETRKGPWTEEEDMQLVCFVGLLGERRWDFIAKVSGLHRTGKSCRLRWVNYLHPGLKHGRMSPQEERLVLELHSRWGNRWSRIARKLPGRTDNEIKNYWRTHMRKKAQERKRNAAAAASTCASSPSSSSSSSSSFSPSTQNPQPEEAQMQLFVTAKDDTEESVKGYYPMEKIWDEIAPSEMSEPPLPPPPLLPLPMNTTTRHSPLWDASDAVLWKVEEDSEEDDFEALMMSMGSDLLVTNRHNGRASLDLSQQSALI